LKIASHENQIKVQRAQECSARKIKKDETAAAHAVQDERKVLAKEALAEAKSAEAKAFADRDAAFAADAKAASAKRDADSEDIMAKANATSLTHAAEAKYLEKERAVQYAKVSLQNAASLNRDKQVLDNATLTSAVAEQRKQDWIEEAKAAVDMAKADKALMANDTETLNKIDSDVQKAITDFSANQAGEEAANAATGAEAGAAILEQQTATAKGSLVQSVDLIAPKALIESAPESEQSFIQHLEAEGEAVAASVGH